MDPHSALHAFKPDTVLFALDAHHLVARSTPARPPQECRGCLTACWTRSRGTGSWPAGFWLPRHPADVPPVFPALFGSNEHRLPGSPAPRCRALNARLRERADAEGVDLLALDDHVARDGLAAWHDPALWHRAKQEIHPAAAAALWRSGRPAARRAARGALSNASCSTSTTRSGVA